MTVPPDTFYLAVPLALSAAVSFGLAGVVQHRATKRVPPRGPMRPSLLLDLAHQPLWVASIAATILGFGLQVAALQHGPLILVQPLLVTGLVFSVLFGALIDRRRPDRVLLIGALLTVAGLTTFLISARPAGGTSTLSTTPSLPLVIGLVVVVAGCLLLPLVVAGTPQALALALATGVLYGITAGIVKFVTLQWQQGLTEPLGHWQLYALCIIGPFAFLLNENAYQAGPLAAPPLAVITTADPLTGIAIGVLWLQERLQTPAPALAGQAAGLAVMIVGIVALAHRTPALVEERSRPAGQQRSG